MMQALHAEGFEAGRKRTRQLMQLLHLHVKQRCRLRATINGKASLPVAEDLLNQHFHPPELNQVWGTDSTCLWTNGGWLYPVVLDLCARRVLGWAMDRRMDKAIRPLPMAVSLKKPPPSLVCQADRGSQ